MESDQNLSINDNMRLDLKGNQKIINSSQMNDTFANWKKNKKQSQDKRIIKNRSKNQNCMVSTDIIIALPKTNDKNNYKGMTLQQYFKSKDQNQEKTEDSACNNSNFQEIDQQKLYYQDNFKINQTDEDNYSENNKKVITPQFRQPATLICPTTKQELQSKLLNKYSKKLSKIKTQTQQDNSSLFNQYYSKQKPRKRFPTMNQQQSAIPMNTVAKIQFKQTFYKDENKKNRIVSQVNQKKQIKSKLTTLSDFYKGDPNGKNNKILQKVQQEKQRLNDLNINEIGFITKYAAKFNIAKSVCKQILRDQKLRL